jgi:hypothetical protein
MSPAGTDLVDRIRAILSGPGITEQRMFGGDISGRNVELVPGRRAVQAWRSNAWPEGVYSIVRFE